MAEQRNPGYIGMRMARSQAYEKLLFELGDRARDQLAERIPPLPGMEEVFDAEHAVLARRSELEALEEQLNIADEEFREFTAQQEEQRFELQAMVKKFRRAVDGIEGLVKDIRKKLAVARAETKLNRDALKSQEIRQKDIEMSPDPTRVEQGRVVLKRLRVAILRKERECADYEAALTKALTPAPGQPGGAGIEAHRRLLLMEDEAILRKEDLQRVTQEYDQAIADKEAEIREAEADLADALSKLGAECYSRRIPEVALTSYYPRLDRLK